MELPPSLPNLEWAVHLHYIDATKFNLFDRRI
jgi:hypothetical protein